MREIFFRGKDRMGGEWVYGDLYQEHHSDGTIKTTIVQPLSVYNVDPDTVGQYTGLTDKNGNKIFEGDIIKSYGSLGDEIIHLIRWNNKEAYYLLINTYSSDCGHINQEWIDEFQKEIIGNICDNPELVNGNQKQVVV